MANTQFFKLYTNILKILLCLSLTAIPLSLNYSNIILATTLVLFFLGYPFLFKNYTKPDIGTLKKLFCSPFVLYIFVLVSLFYTHNTEETLKFVEYRLPFALVPLMFFMGFRLSSRDREIILSGFVYSTIIALLYFIGLGMIGLRNGTLGINELSYTYIENTNALLIYTHRTYLSFYALLSFIIVFGSKSIKYPLFFKIFAAIVTMTCVFSFESRAIIGFSILTLIALPFLGSRKILKYTIPATLGMLLIALSVMYFSGSYDSVKNRILHYNDLKIENNGWESRSSRWLASLDLISQEPITGYGSGTEKDVLKEKYLDNGLIISAETNLDVHNQYLSFALENGIFATLFYCFMLMYISIKGLQRKNVIATLFIVICAGMSLVENILNVNWMISLFAIVSSIYIFEPDSKSH